jgi:transposase InsO family protein
MALSAFDGVESHLNLTHHSDRGVQYCSKEYVKLLQDKNIQISMTENGDPLENDIAERVNGIIKEEYLDNYQISNVSQANDLLNTVIRLYNEDRPHMSISNLTPDKVHYAKKRIETEKLWKIYYQKNTLFVK